MLQAHRQRPAKASAPPARLTQPPPSFLTRPWKKRLPPPGLGESYMDGDFECEDLGRLMAVATANAYSIEARCACWPLRTARALRTLALLQGCGRKLLALALPPARLPARGAGPGACSSLQPGRGPLPPLALASPAFPSSQTSRMSLLSGKQGLLLSHACRTSAACWACSTTWATGCCTPRTWGGPTLWRTRGATSRSTT